MPSPPLSFSNSDLHRLLIFDRKYDCKFDHEWLDDTLNQTNNTNNDQRRTSVASLVSAAMSNSQLPLFLPSSLQQPSSSSNLPPSTILSFHRNKNEKENESMMSKEDSRQLVLGLVYSIRNMSRKMIHSSTISNTNFITRTIPACPLNETNFTINSNNSPFTLITGGSNFPFPIAGEYSFQYSCNRYKLIFYESITGWRFVLLLHNNGNIVPNGILYDLYNGIFQENVIKNPLVDPQKDHFNRQSFINKIDEYFVNLSREKT